MWAGGAAALLCLAPSFGVFAGALLAPHAMGADPAFWPSVFGTLSLVVIGAGGATLIGAAAAWVVAFCRFPGRDVFSWLLAAPLAAPVYVLAYAYGGLTAAGGAIPINLSGAAGAALVYALAFYPYVYLAARAAFAGTSFAAFEAARVHGAGPWRATWAVTLPLAWPGIAAGSALASMEIAADYGAASYFGATTITTQAFRAWFSRGEPQTALQLAGLLLVGAFVLLALERRLRGQRHVSSVTGRGRAAPSLELRGVAAFLACAGCGTLTLLAIALPFGFLIRLALLAPAGPPGVLGDALRSSLVLASIGASVTLLAAILIALSARRAHGRWALLAASAGYAAPGAAMALGGLAMLAAAREAGIVRGLSFGLATGALVWIYAARFAAAGAQPLEAGFARISGAIGQAARVLGAGSWRRFTRISLPLAAPSAVAAALIVFAEILKELPATLILRPLNTDTLAIVAHTYASDDRLMQAALPALLVTAAGLAPVLFLSHHIDGARRP